MLDILGAFRREGGTEWRFLAAGGATGLSVMVFLLPGTNRYLHLTPVATALAHRQVFSQ
jgi:hypothetical protein